MPTSPVDAIFIEELVSIYAVYVSQIIVDCINKCFIYCDDINIIGQN